MKAKGHISVRTFVSCGSKHPKNELIKLMTDKECRLIKDNSCRVNGRGANVSDARPCLKRLSNNKRLNRQFGKDKDIF